MPPTGATLIGPSLSTFSMMLFALSADFCASSANSGNNNSLNEFMVLLMLCELEVLSPTIAEAI
jgi:hypothetical protein